MVLMVRNEAPYLLEWFAFHLTQGATYFKVYDESDDLTGRIVKLLSQKYPIEYNYWPMKYSNTLPVESQNEIYNIASKQLKGKFKFVSFTDVDEFIADINGDKFINLLNSVPDDVSAIAMNQKIFASSGHTNYSPELVTTRFTCRGKDPNSEHTWLKMIARPDKLKHFNTPHCLTVTDGNIAALDGKVLNAEELILFKEGKIKRIVDCNFRLHHYITKSYEEFKTKQRYRYRGDKNSDEVILRSDYRFNDNYFYSRQIDFNKVVDDSFTKFSAPVKEIVKQMHDCLKQDSEVYEKVKSYYNFL